MANLRDVDLPLKLSVIEDGLMTETGLTIKKKLTVEVAHHLPYISTEFNPLLKINSHYIN